MDKFLAAHELVQKRQFAVVSATEVQQVHGHELTSQRNAFVLAMRRVQAKRAESLTCRKTLSTLAETCRIGSCGIPARPLLVRA